MWTPSSSSQHGRSPPQPIALRRPVCSARRPCVHRPPPPRVLRPSSTCRHPKSSLRSLFPPSRASPATAAASSSRRSALRRHALLPPPPRELLPSPNAAPASRSAADPPAGPCRAADRRTLTRRRSCARRRRSTRLRSCAAEGVPAGGRLPAAPSRPGGPSDGERASDERWDELVPVFPGDTVGRHMLRIFSSGMTPSQLSPNQTTSKVNSSRPTNQTLP